MDGMGPLIFLYKQLHKNEPPDSDTLKAAVKCSLSLLANASAHFSTERRKYIMKLLNNDLKPLAEARAKAKADSIMALKRCSSAEAFFRKRRLKVQAPESPPTMGRFLPKLPKVCIQAAGSTSYTEPELPVQEKS